MRTDPGMAATEPLKRAALGLGAGLVAGVLTLVLRLWSAVLRKDTRALERLDRYVADGHQVLAVFWHGKYLPLFPLASGRQAAVITVASFRGQVIAAICRHFGYRPLLLPAETHAHGFEALADLARSKTGLMALALDGPSGPRHRIRSGALQLSARHGVRLAPLGVASSAKIVLGSRWDLQEVPLPFSRVTVAVGELIDLSALADPEDTARLEDIVHRAMDAVEREAAERLGGTTG